MRTMTSRRLDRRALQGLDCRSHGSCRLWLLKSHFQVLDIDGILCQIADRPRDVERKLCHVSIGCMIRDIKSVSSTREARCSYFYIYRRFSHCLSESPHVLLSHRACDNGSFLETGAGYACSMRRPPQSQSGIEGPTSKHFIPLK